MALLTFFAFLAGIVTILSPCILPVLPIVLSGSIGGRLKPLGIITGFIASFSLFTLALSAIVQTLSIPPDTLRFAAVAIILFFGITLAVPKLQMRLEAVLSRTAGRRKTSSQQGFTGGILTGISLGLVWTPCVGPIMASVISLAVSRQVDGGAVIIIAAYSAGTAIPMFALMAGGRKLLARFPRLTARTAAIQRVFGIIMIAAGLSIAAGVDRKFQTFVLDVFPNYGSGLTAIEEQDAVREALEERSGQSGWESADTGLLGDYGEAPPLIAGGPWINSEEPLSMEGLRGKVVIVDFWTYSCINCVRTLPYLRDWYDTYSAYGLEIIGVHSPEFPFERNINNVRKAVEELGVAWPVVLDNDFAQWNSYSNRYWPAHFFIDASGIIRYFHFGEGAYEESEAVIRELLTEAGYELPDSSGSPAAQVLGSRTPEIYLGYSRSEGFLSDTTLHDEKAAYQLAADHGRGQWSIEGEWVIRNDFIEIDGTGSLELSFEAKDLYIVIEPRDEESRVHIEIDGMTPRDTPDVMNGLLKLDESRLYHLADFDESSGHLLKLTIDGHVRLYTFTFG